MPKSLLLVLHLRLAEEITGLNMFSIFFNIFFGFKNFQFLRSSPSTWFVRIIFISPLNWAIFWIENSERLTDRGQNDFESENPAEGVWL